MDILCAVGVPVALEGALYNCGAVFHRGRLLGLIAKESIPNYSEFYEMRYFTPACPPREVVFAGQQTVLGKGLLFPCENVEGLCVAGEICEDLWGVVPPSAKLAQNGATLLFNLSCSDETIGKAEYRRDLVKMWSGHLLGAYVYADAGPGESTTDMVFAGHDILAENGTVLQESSLFSRGLVIGEIDLERLLQERLRMNTWQPRQDRDVVRIPFAYKAETLESFVPRRDFSRFPFVPEDKAWLSDRCRLILTMQSQGLATRLSHIHGSKVVVGLSGGLDSTLALLVCVRAFDSLGLDRKGILAVSMPCLGCGKYDSKVIVYDLRLIDPEACWVCMPPGRSLSVNLKFKSRWEDYQLPCSVRCWSKSEPRLQSPLYCQVMVSVYCFPSALTFAMRIFSPSSSLTPSKM